MKKIIKIFLINILIIFCIVEVLGYLYMKKDHKAVFENATEKYSLRYAPIKHKSANDYSFRPIKYGNSKSGSIIFFGCSFTYGVDVDEDKTLPVQFSETSGLTAVNRGFPAGSISNTLNDLYSENFYKEIEEIPKPVKYIVYMYIPDHLTRITMPYYGFLLNKDMKHYTIGNEYVCKEGKCIQQKPNIFKMFLYHLYITKAYYTYRAVKMQNNLTAEKLFVDMAKQAKTITDEKFPNSKFIMIMWKDDYETPPESTLRKQLTENGFIVLEAEDLAGHELDSLKWKASDKMHPNAEAFSDVAKGLNRYLINSHLK